VESWAPVILYTGLIFALSSIPNLAVPGRIEASDKVAHLCEYFFWGLLLRRGLDRVLRAPDAVVSALAIVTGACLSFLDESFQKSVGRDYSYFDMAADVTGVVLAQIVHDIAVRGKRARQGDA